MQNKVEEFLTSLEVEKGYSENTRVAYKNDLGQFLAYVCLLYTSDAADDLLCVDLGGRLLIKKKKNNTKPN